MEKNLIKLKNINFEYIRGNSVLSNVSLNVMKGECVCLLGTSGVGKTTLFKIIQGILKPQNGNIYYSEDIKKNDIATVTQNYTLFPHLTVLANLRIVLRRKESLASRFFTNNSLENKAKEYLEQVNMVDEALKMPHELSGGQKQRVAIAQALAQESPLILMDEPFGALDEGIREELQSMIIRLKEKLNLGILFITHDLEEAIYLGQQIFLLIESNGSGSIIQKYPILGSIIDSPEIKESENFFREVQALKNYLFRQKKFSKHPEKIAEACNRCIIDESILIQLEQNAEEIWIITPHLKKDVHHPMISKTVKQNLRSGKRYRYITPHMNKETGQNINLFKKKFNEYIHLCSFSSLPTDDPIFLFGEIVIYDPSSIKSLGFTYLSGDNRGMMFVLPETFTKGYIQRIGEFV